MLNDSHIMYMMMGKSFSKLYSRHLSCSHLNTICSYSMPHPKSSTAMLRSTLLLLLVHHVVANDACDGTDGPDGSCVEKRSKSKDAGVILLQGIKKHGKTQGTRGINEEEHSTSQRCVLWKGRWISWFWRQALVKSLWICSRLFYELDESRQNIYI